jgi:hypothetical protein
MTNPKNRHLGRATMSLSLPLHYLFSELWEQVDQRARIVGLASLN